MIYRNVFIKIMEMDMDMDGRKESFSFMALFNDVGLLRAGSFYDYYIFYVL